jgi:hypothetical protein
MSLSELLFLVTQGRKKNQFEQNNQQESKFSVSMIEGGGGRERERERFI